MGPTATPAAGPLHLMIEGRIRIVDILFTQPVFGQAQAFAEVINLSKAIEPIAAQWFSTFSMCVRTGWTGPIFWRNRLKRNR